MAKFARRNKDKRRRTPAAAAAVAAAAVVGPALTAALPLLPAALLVNGSAAHADTTGNEGGLFTGLAIWQLFGFSGLPADTDADEFDDTRFAYIRNEYMGVVLGVAGSYTQFDVTKNIAGAISFGNTGGNLRGGADNNQPLNGFNGGQGFTLNGSGTWPLANSFAEDGVYDYPAYIKARVITQNGGGGNGGGPGDPGGGGGGGGQGDETILNVGFEEDDYISTPQFLGNALVSEVRLAGEDPIPSEGGAVTLKQNIQLRRNTARIEWRLSNYDTVASHTVYLRFTINHRGAGNFGVRDGFFFTDPQTGITNPLVPVTYGVNTDNLPPTPVPSQINILGGRYQDPASTARPYYHGRLIFRGPADATIPSSVYVGDPDDMEPEQDNFDPLPAGQRERFTDGIATAVYFGPIALRPNQQDQQTIVFYYGNGSSDDSFSANQTLGLEAEESLQFNAGAAQPENRPAYNGNNYAEVARAFLTPSQLTVFGSLYNNTVDNALEGVQYRNVAMTLNLPSGLRFATDPATGVQDVATKAPQTGSTINADTDGIARWLVEPTGETFGTAVYQLIGIVGEPGPTSRSVSRSLTIPATPLYPVTSRGYQTIGVPFQFDDTLSNGGDVRTVLNTLSDVPGQPREEFPVLFGWDARRQAYVANVQTLETARGYFYRPAENRILFAAGVRPTADQAPTAVNAPITRFQGQTLEPGWNLISNPFLYDVPLSSLAFITTSTDENANLAPLPFTQAVAAGVVRGSLWFFDPNLSTEGDYDFLSDPANDTLRPWVGYWVYLNDRRTLTFSRPAQPQSAILNEAAGPTRQQKVKGAIASGRAFGKTPTLEDWRLQLVAKHRAGRTDGATLLGVSPGAKDGDDGRDLLKPPAVMGDLVQVGIVRSGSEGQVGSGGSGSRLAQDLRAPGGGTKSWDVEVASEQGGPVTLSWPNISKLPKRLRLTLKDEQTGRTVNLRSNSSFQVNVPAGGRSRFTITAGRELSRPLAMSGFKIERGGKAQDGSRPYNFAFALSSDAQVSARILDVRGRQVDVVATGRSATAGETRLYWRGRTQDNKTLPIGAYMVEITARSESSGDVVTEKRPLMILR